MTPRSRGRCHRCFNPPRNHEPCPSRGCWQGRRTRQLGGRPAGLETGETADLEVCGTENPPTTSGCATMNSFAQLADGDGTLFLLRWRGRQEGPYSGTVVEAKLAAHEIGLQHEIYYEGKWVTLRDYGKDRRARCRKGSPGGAGAEKNCGRGKTGPGAGRSKPRRRTRRGAEKKRPPGRGFVTPGECGPGTGATVTRDPETPPGRDDFDAGISWSFHFRTVMPGGLDHGQR